MADPTPIRCCAPLSRPVLDEGQLDGLEQVFKALADRHRVKILNALSGAGGEAICVCDFEELLGLKQSTVSYHLKQLVDAGLLTREKRGTFSYYALVPGSLDEVGALLTATAPKRRRVAA